MNSFESSIILVILCIYWDIIIITIKNYGLELVEI